LAGARRMPVAHHALHHLMVDERVDREVVCHERTLPHPPPPAASELVLPRRMTAKRKMPIRPASSKPKSKSVPAARQSPSAETLQFRDARAWAAWLTSHHASSRGVWVKLGKRGAGIASLTYPEALEVALAWGWIDGQKRACDEAWWLQRFTPRGPRSPWS